MASETFNGYQFSNKTNCLLKAIYKFINGIIKLVYTLKFCDSPAIDTGVLIQENSKTGAPLNVTNQ